PSWQTVDTAPAYYEQGADSQDRAAPNAALFMGQMDSNLVNQIRAFPKQRMALGTDRCKIQRLAPRLAYAPKRGDKGPAPND
ncbi:MAG: hypothetical protein ACOYLL_14330, partial [Beijerinckiaceae bacterium]